MKVCKKTVSLLLAVLTVLTVMLSGAVPGTVKVSAASWNGYNYGGGSLYGYQTFLEAFGIDYDVYMKWLDDHDADSPNPDYYLGTPYVGEDHRNPRGDCQGAYGSYDTPGVAAMNCTGFVWHVLYKSAVNSGAPSYKVNRLSVMSGMPRSWFNYGVYRIYFNTIEEAYNSGVLEKGDLFWIYGSSDSHNAIFYGDSPQDFIYWDSAGARNRYSKVHSIGTCQGLWVAKVTQPNNIELHMNTASGGSGVKFGTKYCIFNSKAEAQAVIDDPEDNDAWDERIGTIVLNSSGHGVLRTQSAPAATDLWNGDKPKTSHSYFDADAKRVSSKNTYYAVQWSHGSGIEEDKTIHVFKDSGDRTGKGYRIFECYAPIKVDAPKITSMKSISDGVRIRWNAVKGAYKYRIYYKNKSGSWVRMAETDKTSYIDSDVKNGTSYRYTMRCIDKYGNLISDYDTSGWTIKYTKLATPEITSCETTADGVKLTWNAVDGAEKYRAYYKNKNGSWVRMTETSDTTYTDMEVAPGTTYTYTVRCTDNDGDFVSGFNKTGWKHTFEGVAAPKMESVTSETDGVRLRWTPVEGASKYRAYYKNKNGNWVRMTETEGTEYLDADVAIGKTYTYTVRCVNSKGYFTSNYDQNGWKCAYKGGDAPEITSLTSEADGVHISWDPVEGASKYRVFYKSKTKGWTRLLDTADTNCVDDVVALNTAYTYTVRCVNPLDKYASDYNHTGWTYTYTGVDAPAAPVSENTAEGVKISWNAVEGAAKYRVYYLDGNGSWKELETTSATEIIDADVREGGSRTYAVRCIGPRGNLISGYTDASQTITYIAPTEELTPAEEPTAE